MDIVNLIESNPITKMNGDYQSKLIEKVKDNFNGYEQQMFLASFYCYLNHDYKNDFVIDLDNVWQWLDFYSKYNAKYLLEKQFILDRDYKILSCHPNIALPTGKAKTNIRGGHNKEIIMLNINTFKRFCLKAGTKKANEIHEYFIKLEEILQEIIKEESDELKQQFLQLEDKKNKELKDKLDQQKILDRESILLHEYATSGCIFYIIKIKTLDNGQYIVKVGESRRGVKDRYNEHKIKYDECLLLDCFSVNQSKDFESFVKDNELIRPNKVCDLKGHETELELFLIGKNLSYKTLLTLVNNNINHFNNHEIEKIKLENENLKIMNQMKTDNNDNVLIQSLNSNIIQLSEIMKQMSGKIDNLEKTNKTIVDRLNSLQTKTTTNFGQPLSTVGPRLQKIHPETMLLVTVYESVSELMKENCAIKRVSINKAVVESTIYCGFRWLFVERHLDPTIISAAMAPTKYTKSQNLGYIAKLNLDKTEILNVYLNRKMAAHFNGYESNSALDLHVKRVTPSKGFYYILYDTCNTTLKNAFVEKNNGEPILYKDGVGQYDHQHHLIKEFICKYDCIRTLRISDKTLAKSLDKQVFYNDCYFKTLGSKFKCL